MKPKKGILLAIILVFIGAFSACGNSGTIKIQPTLTIEVGQSTTLTTEIVGLDASELRWNSSNTSIATVNDEGLVLGVSEGEATITASLGSINATCEVNVVPASEDPDPEEPDPEEPDPEEPDPEEPDPEEPDPEEPDPEEPDPEEPDPEEPDPVDPAKLLSDAKTTKLSQIPDVTSFNEQEYTVASWELFTGAVSADISSIESFTTVEEVEGYTITAQITLLTVKPRIAFARYIEGWVESNEEHPWSGNLTYAKFLNAFNAFNASVTEETSEEDAQKALDVFLAIEHMALRKAKEDAKKELRANFSVYSSYRELCGSYWTTVETKYHDGLSSIDSATSLAQSGTATVNNKRTAAINGLDSAALGSIRTMLVVGIDAYISTLSEDDYTQEKWQQIHSIAESRKDEIRNATSPEVAIEKKEDTIDEISKVPQKLDTMIALAQTLNEGVTDASLVVDAYNALLVIKDDWDMFNALNAAVPYADMIIAKYIHENNAKVCEYRLMEIMRNVYFGRLTSTPSSFNSAVVSIKTLMNTAEQNELNSLIASIKQDFAAFDWLDDYFKFVSDFEERLIDYERMLWDIDWKDDYILKIRVDLDGGYIDGVTEEELVFELRIRFVNQALQWRFDLDHDSEYQRLLGLAAPQKEDSSFQKWMMENEWYLYIISIEEIITGAEWRAWDDPIWQQGGEGAAKDFLTNIDLTRLSAGQFVSKVNSTIHIYPNLEIVIKADWKSTSGGVEVAAEAFIGTWVANGVIVRTLVITEDNRATDAYTMLGETYTTEYTWQMSGDVMILTGSITRYLKLGDDGKIEFYASADLVSYNMLYEKVE